MSKYLPLIKKLLAELEKEEIIFSLEERKGLPDEPPFYRYRAYLDPKRNQSVGGGSFNSRELALLKCLGEAIERYAVFKNWSAPIIKSNYVGLTIRKKSCVDPYLFTRKIQTRQESFGWIETLNLINNKTVLIPAQSVFLGYQHFAKEKYLVEGITTGAAGGTDHYFTLLKGIYEIIERDAFMTIYLNKISAPSVDLKSLGLKEINYALDKTEQYNLEIRVFNTTNDIGIPSFLAIILDRSGIGPAVTVGLKASLDINNAIIGCVEEAFYIRPWLRHQIINHKKNTFKYPVNKIRVARDRAFFWMSPQMIGQLDFLLNQKPQKLNFKQVKYTLKQELDHIINLFRDKETDIYYFDITPKAFKEIGYLVYKMVIPKLQSLYLHERHKKNEIRIERLQDVSKFFGKELLTINNIPHPML